MPLSIDSLDDLQALLEQSGLKLSGLDDLRSLLAEVNASYNPDAARVHLARQLGLGVPGIMTGAAAAVSFFIVFATEGFAQGGSGPLTALGVVWGVAGLVSLAALGASLFTLFFRRSTPSTQQVADLASGAHDMPTPSADRPNGMKLPDGF